MLSKFIFPSKLALDLLIEQHLTAKNFNQKVTFLGKFKIHIALGSIFSAAKQ